MAALALLMCRILADRQGAAFGYSSLLLLLAVAAVAVIAQAADAST